MGNQNFTESEILIAFLFIITYNSVNRIFEFKKLYKIMGSGI